MTLRLWLELGLVALAAAAGWGYVHQRDQRLRAEGRLELVQARADSTADAADAAVARSVGAEAAAEEAIRREEAARAEAERRAERAAAAQPAAAERVVGAASPADTAAVRARLDELVALHAQETTALRDQIRSDAIIIAELRALDVTRLAAIASLESALAAAQDVGRTALETRPGFIQRNLPKVLIPIAFVSGVVVGLRAGG